jgi:hypothetical protein
MAKYAKNDEEACKNSIWHGRYSTRCARLAEVEVDYFGRPTMFCKVCAAAKKRGDAKQAENARADQAKWDRIAENDRIARRNKLAAEWIESNYPDVWAEAVEAIS